MATTLANPGDLKVAADNNSLAQTNATQDIARQPNLVRNTAIQAAAPSGLGNILAQPAVKKACLQLSPYGGGSVCVDVQLDSTPPYRAVYPGLTEADRQAAYTALVGSDFSAKIDSKTGELQVPGNRYHEARLFLASRGLPQSATSGGMAALSKDSSMTTSQFMEQVRYVSAIEQELAQSISQIGSIQSARVHLASPKQSVLYAVVRQLKPRLS